VAARDADGDQNGQCADLGDTRLVVPAGGRRKTAKNVQFARTPATWVVQSDEDAPRLLTVFVTLSGIPQHGPRRHGRI
jgi:hypothetical protein